MVYKVKKRGEWAIWWRVRYPAGHWSEWSRFYIQMPGHTHGCAVSFDTRREARECIRVAKRMNADGSDAIQFQTIPMVPRGPGVDRLKGCK